MKAKMKSKKAKKKSSAIEVDEDIANLLDNISFQATRELSLQFPEIDEIAADRDEEGNIDTIEWKEDPTTFHEFVNDSFHMGQPPLSKRQQNDIEKFLGRDPKKIFSQSDIENNLYRLAALLWGKGSGKDWICSMIQCYLVYLLLCMEDPRHTVGIAPGEAIDIVNVAYSAKQANEVYFTKFLSRVLNWKWLREGYPLVHHRKVINRKQFPDVELDPDGMNYVKIGAGIIDFPEKIRAISEHSENESYEGYNILFWIMDEAAAFRNAGKKANAHNVFSTLRTSATSRFPRLWRGICISYPRSDDDFMMRTYRMAVKDPEWFASKGSTWEINPTKLASDFASDFEKWPVDSKAKYMCDPPPRFGAAFDPENVDACVADGVSGRPFRESLLITRPTVISQTIREATTGIVYSKEMVGKDLVHVAISNLVDKAKPRVFHVDGGLTNCPAGFVLAHAEPVIINKQALNRVVVDAVLQWKPIPSRRLQVSLNNIAAVIAEMVKAGVNIVLGSYDQWNSASALEALFMSGIPVEEHNITTADYMMVEQLVNLGCVSLPGDEYSEYGVLTTELKNLIRTRRGDKIKYDLPKIDGESIPTNADGSPLYTKDVADCLAGVSRLLNAPEIRAAVGGGVAPRVMTGPSLHPKVNIPITMEKETASKGYMPTKIAHNVFPTEAGFMGRQMDQSRMISKQHRMLTEVAGNVELKGHINELSRIRPPTPIIKR